MNNPRGPLSKITFDIPRDQKSQWIQAAKDAGIKLVPYIMDAVERKRLRQSIITESRTRPDCVRYPN